MGFAPREELDGEFVDVTSREGFQIAHDISSYSFIALAKEAKNMMENRKRVFTDFILLRFTNDSPKL